MNKYAFAQIVIYKNSKSFIVYITALKISKLIKIIIKNSLASYTILKKAFTNILAK